MLKKSWWKEVHCNRCKTAVHRVVVNDDNTLGGEWFWFKCHGEAFRTLVPFRARGEAAVDVPFEGFVIRPQL